LLNLRVIVTVRNLKLCGHYRVYGLDGILLSFRLAALITSNELGYELSQRESSWNPPKRFPEKCCFWASERERFSSSFLLV
jgi:hypothetical protein